MHVTRPLRRYSFILVLGLLGLAGCLAAAQSSRAVLGADLSQSEATVPPREAALAVTRLFANRGYPLTDQVVTTEGLVLRFKGQRESITSGGRRSTSSTQFGSVFYVAVNRAPGDHSTVVIDGAPVIDDVEACAGPGRGPCGNAHVDLLQGDHIDGRAEAEVVRGVFAELVLEGLAIPLPPDHPAMVRVKAEALAQCNERRREVFDEAKKIVNTERRLEHLRSAPVCR